MTGPFVEGQTLNAILTDIASEMDEWTRGDGDVFGRIGPTTRKIQRWAERLRAALGSAVESEKAAEWQTGKPPNETLVEVENGDRIIRVKAIWGRDGTLPHWESEDDNTHWETSAFHRWRPSAAKE